jgi:hypothetical protein
MHLVEEEFLEELLTLKDEMSLISSPVTRPPAVSVTKKESIVSLKKLTRNEASICLKQSSEV